MGHRSNYIYEFGSFRLDAGERLLLHEGESVPLTPKSFDLLLALVEHHGHLLEKDELMKLVWPDTFVEEANLSYNISLIRKALGDGENGQKFIETVPKRGYRFVTDVTELASGETPQVGSSRPGSGVLSETTGIKHYWHVAGFAIALLIVAGIIFGLYQSNKRQQSLNGSAATPLKIIPLNSYQGTECHPVFSPDGSQIAFVWDKEEEGPGDIYVRQVGADGLLQLTASPADERSPVWSPDGRYITFMRYATQESGIYLVPAIGGAERKLVTISEGFGSRLANRRRLAWSPDGKLLAISDRHSKREPVSIFLIQVETGEKRRLTHPSSELAEQSSPVFSPDGKTLAFIQLDRPETYQICLISVTGGTPQILSFDPRLDWSHSRIYDLAWTTDGRYLVLSGNVYPNPMKLWRIPVGGGVPEEIAVGDGVGEPAISPQGNRLAFTKSMGDLNIWRLDLTRPTNGTDNPSIFIRSTRPEGNPEYSPDGSKIVFGSFRTGLGAFWVSDGNGANEMQLTNLAGAGSPRWSPDGQQIVFDALSQRNRDIYSIRAEGGQPRRLTYESSEEGNASYSRDGKWIYFCTNRSGQLQIWKMPSEGGAAVQVTNNGGYEAIESLDGKYLYYTKGRLTPGIWRVPIEGGTEMLILDYAGAGYARHWTVVAKGIYFVTVEDPRRPVIRFFHFTTGQVSRIYVMEKPVLARMRGITLSPDGRYLLYTQVDQSGSDILLMENFR